MQPLAAALKVCTTELRRQSPSGTAAAADWCASPRTPRGTPRTPPVITCSGSSSSAGATPGPRLSRRRWTTPQSLAAAAETVAPPSPCTPPPPSPDGGVAQAEAQQQQQQKPVYDCVDVATQSLAVNLTLEEYRATLQAASACASPQQASGGGGAAPTAASLPSLSHLSLSSAELEAMGLCSHCRYPCYLSGMPECEASRYLQLWDADAELKPRGFDAAAGLRLRGVADIAAVSSGGRANGRWKTDNQDAFLVVPTASAAAAAVPGIGSGDSWCEDSSSSSWAAPSAAAIGIFDGHGKLGGEAARTVRGAIAERLAALSPADAAAAAAAGLPGAAALLDGCFSAAEAALQASGRDYSKSGCTAVLALLDRDSVSVAWAGDSRAVLGVVDTTGSLLGSLASGSAGSLSSGELPDEPASPGTPASTAFSPTSGSNNVLPMMPLCAAVPLTEDHKPDRPGERARITAAGGRVTRIATDRDGQPAGPYRVFVPNAWSPGLALSRAFGDTLACTVGVTSKPEVTVLPLPSPPPAPPAPSSAPRALSNASAASCCSLEARGVPAGGSSERHVLIVASDGLWEWMDNATAVGIASSAPTADDAAHALVEAAQKQWAVRYRGRNCDDITVVVAFLDR